jgi:hypothetical protein
MGKIDEAFLSLQQDGVTPPMKPCALCKKENAVYKWNDNCPACQRRLWLAEEYARIMNGQEPVGLVPPMGDKQWKCDNGTGVRWE